MRFKLRKLVLGNDLANDPASSASGNLRSLRPRCRESSWSNPISAAVASTHPGDGVTDGGSHDGEADHDDDSDALFYPENRVNLNIFSAFVAMADAQRSLKSRGHVYIK